MFSPVHFLDVTNPKGNHMPIQYKLLTDGGFVVGDTETGITAYAYPSSEHATKARKNPSGIASEMIKRENEIAFCHMSNIGLDHDARNWGLLR
jgi:hypothetical protein